MRGDQVDDDDYSDANRVAFDALPFFLWSDESPLRYMFIKPHKTPEHDDENTIFMSGIPSGLTEEECLQFVTAFGPVTTLAMHPTRSSALVVFESHRGADKMIKDAKKGKPRIIRRIPRQELFGLKAWVKGHAKACRPGNAALQRQLDRWMEEFEEREAREKEEAMARMEDDGWTVVRRYKGRKKNTDEASGITVGAVAPAAAQEIAKKRQRRDAVYENFYASQKREKRRSGRWLEFVVFLFCYLMRLSVWLFHVQSLLSFVRGLRKIKRGWRSFARLVNFIHWHRDGACVFLLNVESFNLYCIHLIVALYCIDNPL